MVACMKAGVSFERFWDATGYECNAALRAYGERIRDWHRVAAWHLAPMLSAWGSKAITPQDLLGESSPRESKWSIVNPPEEKP